MAYSKNLKSKGDRALRYTFITIIIIYLTLFVTYVRLCGDWKVRFDVLADLNMMAVFWPEHVDLTAYTKRYCTMRWFLFSVNDGFLSFGSDVVQLVGSVMFFDGDSFLPALLCISVIILVIIFLETEDAS